MNPAMNAADFNCQVVQMKHTCRNEEEYDAAQRIFAMKIVTTSQLPFMTSRGQVFPFEDEDHDGNYDADQHNASHCIIRNILGNYERLSLFRSDRAVRDI